VGGIWMEVELGKVWIHEVRWEELLASRYRTGRVV
jgi:hypothetical protein